MGRVTDLPPSFVQSIPGAPLDVNATFGDMLVQNHSIEDIPVPIANTEQYFDLPAGVKRFSIYSKNDGIVKLGIDLSIATKYRLLPPGSLHDENALDPSVTHKIYFSSSKASDILQLTYWT